MSRPFAEILFTSGRGHALSADLLYKAAYESGLSKGIADPELFAFNGPHSLSIHYLLGLGLELMLKAAIVEWSGDKNEKLLRYVGHDLIRAIDEAERFGFHSAAPHLRDILAVLHEPFKAHWFRYERPEGFPLPGDFEQVVETLDILDRELWVRIWPETDRAT